MVQSTQALNTGSYVTNDCTNCNPTAVSGLTDDAIETLYENRFDDTLLYGIIMLRDIKK